MKTIAFFNLKGGVGKTTAAVNCACLWAQKGLRTLLCDLDPQGAASFSLNISPGKYLSAKKFSKGGKLLLDSILKTELEKLDIIPSSISFRKLDIKLDKTQNPEKQFEKILSPLNSLYDIVILDCPSGLGVEIESAMNAASHVVIPVTPATLSIEAYKKVLEFCHRKGIFSPVVSAFFSMVQLNNAVQKTIMKSYFDEDDRFLKSVIPYFPEMEKMSAVRKAPVQFAPDSKSAVAFTGLWKELHFLIYGN